MYCPVFMSNVHCARDVKEGGQKKWETVWRLWSSRIGLDDRCLVRATSPNNGLGTSKVPESPPYRGERPTSEEHVDGFLTCHVRMVATSNILGESIVVHSSVI
jgi:hypothetical protein